MAGILPGALQSTEQALAGGFVTSEIREALGERGGIAHDRGDQLLALRPLLRRQGLRNLLRRHPAGARMERPRQLFGTQRAAVKPCLLDRPDEKRIAATGVAHS